MPPQETQPSTSQTANSGSVRDVTQSSDPIYENLTGGIHEFTDDGRTVSIPDDEEGEVAAPGTEGAGSAPGDNGGNVDGGTGTPAQQVVDPQQPNLSADQIEANLQLRQYVQTYIPALERERNQLQSQVTQLHQGQQHLASYAQEITSHGLTPEEARQGLALAAQYKSNPTQLISALIAHAKANNIPLPADTPNVFDPRSVTALIQQQLQPILQRFQKEDQTSQESAQQDTEIGEFFRDFPDAGQHEDYIAQVLQRLPPTLGNRVRMERAYWMTRNWAIQNGLDWNQPLQPQIVARQAGTNQGPPRTNNSNRAPLSTGRSTLAMNGSTNPGTVKPANPSDSWESIIHQSVREFGVNG
jgi:hypothetical protein